MKVHLEPTDRIVEIETMGGSTVPGRVWQGVTDNGVEVACVITRVATLRENNQAEFERALTPVAPGRPAREAFPLRMIL